MAANVKSSYFVMQRARKLGELAHRVASVVQLQPTTYTTEDAQFSSTKAKLEVEVFQADLEYRQALATLKALMHEH